MLLNRFLCMAFGLSLAMGAANARDIKCPATYTKNGKLAHLDSASVFEGKPENLVDLMPDLQMSEWDISPNQNYVRERGEHMYLVCRYKGIKETIDLEIPAEATFCKVEETRTGTAAWCKASPRRI